MLNHDKGFTLIELMITLVIMSILLAVAAPNFQNWMDSSKIKSIAESMSSGVNLARSYSLKTNSFNTLQLDPTFASNVWSVGNKPIKDCDDNDIKDNPIYVSDNNSSSLKNIKIETTITNCAAPDKIEPFCQQISFNGLGNVVGYNSYDIVFTNTSNPNVTPIKLHISPSGDTFTCLLINDANNKNSCVFKQNRRGGQC